MVRYKKFLSISLILLIYLFLNAYIITFLLNPNKYTETAKDKQTSTVQLQNDENDYVLFKSHSFSVSQSNKTEQIAYIIKPGDTLWDISQTLNVDIESIISANNLDSPDKLKIGQEIIIPKVSSSNNTTNTKSLDNAKLASRSGSISSKSALTGVWPVKGRLSSGFGMRGNKFHKGIDIAAPTGTSVSAFANGKVIFSGWDNGGYGYLIIISHGNGIETYYGHNSKLLVKTGQSVNMGDLIAKVGNTGDSDGSHCHFEIRKNGTPVNPLNYLK